MSGEKNWVRSASMSPRPKAAKPSRTKSSFGCAIRDPLLGGSSERILAYREADRNVRSARGCAPFAVVMVAVPPDHEAATIWFEPSRTSNQKDGVVRRLRDRLGVGRPELDAPWLPG